MSEKYPRTPHLPWSHGRTDDDKTLQSAAHFIGKEIVITEKIDGSNLCLTRNNLFARSHKTVPVHQSFSYAKSIHAGIRNLIPPGVSVFGEYCYAVHSIEYSELPGYFLIFAVRDDVSGDWLEWDEVVDESARLGMPTAPFLWRGKTRTERDLEDITLCMAKEPFQKTYPFIPQG